MFAASNGRTKVAFIDLIRLLLSFEVSAGHILYNHWEELEVHIFQQLLCLDVEDPEDKELHSYHLISLRMVGALHSTNTGASYSNLIDISKAVILFLKNSFCSASPKVVATAAAVLFNHLVRNKKDLSELTQHLKISIQEALLALNKAEDDGARLALLLVEAKIIHRNDSMLGMVLNSKDQFTKVHNALRAKTQDERVLEAI